MVSVKQILEAVLFCSNKPLPAKALQAVFKSAAETAPEEDTTTRELAKIKEPQVREALEALQAEYAGGERGFFVTENAGGWQLVTNSECGPWVKQLFPELKPARLSAPALETLAIIAYRQPITRADVEAVRGVAIESVLQTLMERGLVRIAGRAEVPGRPLLYETTQFFLEHFGLRDLDELPNAEELKRRELPKAAVAPVPAPSLGEPVPNEPAFAPNESATT
jgi:segregation and condensation protein B